MPLDQQATLNKGLPLCRTGSITVVMYCLVGQDSYYPTLPVFQARSNNVAETLRKFKSHPRN